jgi:hypothetical protein
MNLQNNIAYQNAGEIYIDGSLAQIKGDHNEWFGVGNGPTQTINNINADPLFVNRTAADFHLTSTSPAKDTGLTIVQANSFNPSPGPTIGIDKDGVLRPQGTAFDLGAYEFFTGAVVRPNPPGSVTAVVH